MVVSHNKCEFLKVRNVNVFMQTLFSVTCKVCMTGSIGHYKPAPVITVRFYSSDTNQSLSDATTSRWRDKVSDRKT